jgi:5-methylthioadenosine/S-adenosylhomocysteine deaminase
VTANSLLIENCTLVTNDPARRIIRGCSLAVEEDKIVKIGRSEDLRADYSNSEIKLDGRGKIVIPGLVQAHTHVMGHIFKGFTEDGAEEAFYKVCLPMEDYITRDDAYWLSMIGLIEVLKFGTTMINDIFHYSSETARAVQDIGIRGIIEHKVFDVESLANIKDMNYRRDFEKGIRKLNENEKLIKEWNGASNGRIRCWVGNHAPDTNSPELLKAGRELANKYKVGIHIHVAQSKREVSYIKQTYGKTSVEFLDSLDFLKPDVVCAHLAFATIDDIAILERTGANMAHCPVIMGKFGSFPRIAEFLNSKKVKIGMGSDWVTLNPWDDLRSAVTLTRAVTGNIKLQNATRSFEMMTLGSTNILGVRDQVGSLEVGKKADFVVIDAKRPNLVPMKDIIPTLVYNMTGNEVETVVCDGKIVLDHGKVAFLDESKVMDKAQEIAEGIWEKGGVWPPKENS